MTKEKFAECLLSSRFRECYSDSGYTLYERDGNYIFAYEDHIASSSTSPEWTAGYDEIRLVRSRQGWFEIEKTDGVSITLVKEDDVEIGCMG